MDNTTLPFYFAWKALKIGQFHPIELEPVCYGPEYEKHETLIVVPVPREFVADQVPYALTKEGAEFCIEYLRNIFEPKKELPQDNWELEASKADDNIFDDEIFNS